MPTLIVGCGYLGKRVGQKLVKRGEQVYGTTRSPKKAETLSAIGIKPILFDVLDEAKSAALPVVDRLVYCVGFDRSAGASQKAVYVDGLERTLKTVGPGIEHLVYVSSTGVYGQARGEWVTEETPAEPNTESGRNCLAAEQILSQAGGVASILRFSGLYGPGRIIGKGPLLAGEPIRADPSGWLNLIEIDDAAEAAILVLERGESGRVYLATDDRPVERREYYERVARLLEVSPPQFEHDGGAQGMGRRDQTNKRVSNRRIKQELGFVLESPDIRQGLLKAFRAEAN